MGGRGSACGNGCCFIFRGFVALIAATIGLLASCVLGTFLNAHYYGMSWHQTLGETVQQVPAPIFTGLLFVLPHGAAALVVRKLMSGRSACLRTLVAALIGGLMLGLLVAPPPGPYMEGVKDIDIQSKTADKAEL